LQIAPEFKADAGFEPEESTEFFEDSNPAPTQKSGARCRFRMDTPGCSPLNILAYPHDRFVDAFHRRYGKGAHYSTPVYRRVMKTGRADFHGLEAFQHCPELAGRLKSELMPAAGRVVKRVTDGGVVKFITRLADNLDIESVVIPMYGRNTLCVSSQVGCRMGCCFCRTGKMGLIRDLTAAEIVGQVFTARHRLGLDIRNVVFMGMGEPLDNLDSVIRSIQVLSDQRGMDIARRYITVSTVGLTEGIARLAVIDGGPVNLAVSLNAPNDQIRSRLMPINRTIPMDKLKETLRSYPLSKKSSLFLEYVLIHEINDNPAHARALAAYLSSLKCKLNLIPYNASPHSPLQTPSAEAIRHFRARLVAENVFVRRRAEKGSRIMAACGQLGGRQNDR
jgi:23S rRNA (adenine2503-C2)-methyltransferase